MRRATVICSIALASLLGACGGKVFIDPVDGGAGGAGGNVGDGGAGGMTSCACQTPNNPDESLPFCDRVCDGVFTNWNGPCGTTQFQIDCSAGDPNSVCLVNPENGSAFCG